MKEKTLRLISYVLVAAMASFLTAWTMTAHQPGQTKLDQLESLILEKFIGETDADILADGAADGMVTATGDRWSYYISAQEYEAYTEQMNNAYVGIGITIQMTQGEDGMLVIQVNPGGPAEEAGFQVGDVMTHVGGQSLAGMDTTQVRNLVRGKEGTTVEITVRRKGTPITMEVERREVKTQVASQQLLSNGIGLVTIENFDSRCGQETIAAIEAVMDAGADKLILDVRNNPGGYASELVEVLDYLLPEGEVFHTVDYAGEESFDYSDEDCLEVPMVVLVNGESYSAAEFFAAAIREYEAGLVVGEQTCGKGYFQQTYRLKDGSAVSLSVGKYYTPQGKNLAGVGVTPDVTVELDEQTALEIYAGTLPPEEDPQIQAAMELLQNG